MSWAAALLLSTSHFFGAVSSPPCRASDDGADVERFEVSLAHLLFERDRFPRSVPPPAVEAAIGSCLAALGRLEPMSARVWARKLVDDEPCTQACWAGRRVLAATGDVSIVRRALDEYFDARAGWRFVLGAAFHAMDDVRLRDFAAYEAPSPGLDPIDVTPSLRASLETDDVSLRSLPMEPSVIDAFYPYLAWSRQREVRARLQESRHQRGKALAALLFSPKASLEEKRTHVRAMPDAWAGAIESGAYDPLLAATGEAAIREFVRAHESSAALVRVPLPEARQRLVAIATADAIARLASRPDRMLAMGAVHALRGTGDDDVRFQANAYLLELGAPGAELFFLGELGSAPLADVLASVMRAPSSTRFTERIVRAVAERQGPEPDAVAAMSGFHRRYPREFLSWLEPRAREALVERAHFVMALSGDAHRLPLLTELAVVGGRSEVSREAGFRGLSEQNLGRFDKRLHRLAGDEDPWVRFSVALALTPTGDDFAVRLLLAELDENERADRVRAANAFERLGPSASRRILESMILDGTASPFGVEVYWKLGGIPERLRAPVWELIAPLAASGDAHARRLQNRLRGRAW